MKNIKKRKTQRPCAHFACSICVFFFYNSVWAISSCQAKHCWPSEAAVRVFFLEENVWITFKPDKLPFVFPFFLLLSLSEGNTVKSNPRAT